MENANGNLQKVRIMLFKKFKHYLQVRIRSLVSKTLVKLEKET